MTNPISDYTKILAGFLEGLVLYFFAKHLNINDPAAFLTAQSAVGGISYFLFGVQLSPFYKNTKLHKVGLLLFLAILFAIVNHYLLDPYTFQQQQQEFGIHVSNNTNVAISNLDNFTKFLRVAFIPQYLLSLFIFFIFYCAYIDNFDDSSMYQKLFKHLWRVIFTTLIFAPLISLIIWALLHLISSSFLLLDIHTLKNIISKPLFIYLATAIFYAIGVVLVDRNQFVINKLRDILLSICKILYPVFSIAALIFMVTATAFSHIAFASYSWIFVIISVAHVILYNGIYQAGIETRPYNKILTLFIMVFIIIIPFYLLASIWQYYSIVKVSMDTAGLALGVKISLMFLFFLFAYTAGYAIAIFMPQKKYWCEFSSTANVAVSLIGALIFLATIFIWV